MSKCKKWITQREKLSTTSLILTLSQVNRTQQRFRVNFYNYTFIILLPLFSTSTCYYPLIYSYKRLITMWCKNNPPFPYVTTFTSNKHRNRWWLGAIGPIFPRVTCKIILVINKIVDQRDVKARWPWPFAAYFALRGDPRTFAGTCTRVTNGHEYSVARTTAEIYSERWCRQLAHPPPRRINFISTVLSDHPLVLVSLNRSDV